VIELRVAGEFEHFAKSEIEQSIPDRFAQQAERYPDRTAVVAGEIRLSYVELNASANRVAQALLARGTQAGEAVALMFEQGAGLVSAILGVLKAGGVYVPLDPEYPRRTSMMLKDAGARTILADRVNLKLAEELAGGAQHAVCVRDDAEGPVGVPGVKVEAGAPAYIYYTSGSTGKPKGVVDSHRNVLHNVMRYTNGLKICSGDRLTLLQTASFSGAVSSLFSALLNGGTLYPLNPRRQSAAEFAEWVVANRLTMWHSVPSVFRQLCLDGRPLPSLRVIRLEGDQASPNDIGMFQRMFERGCVLVNGLGTTETGIARQFFVDQDTKLRDGVVPIGYPVEDMEVLLEGGGEVGEIAVKSRYLATGYWLQPELTRERFRQCENDPKMRIYRTGDLGRFQEDGCLEFLGRSGSRVKVRGQWVQPAEVESALCQLPEVSQAAVVVRKDAQAEKRLVGYVVPSGGAAPSVGALRGALEETLPGHLIPSVFVVLESLPLNENGKVDRRKLPQPERARPRLTSDFAAPGTEAEKTLAGIWAEVLGLDEVGIDDNFFELGGDSMYAQQVVARIRIDGLSLNVFLEALTVRELARSVARL
jgi:amino acid adenylation domain-containing protein